MTHARPDRTAHLLVSSACVLAGASALEYVHDLGHLLGPVWTGDELMHIGFAIGAVAGTTFVWVASARVVDAMAAGGLTAPPWALVALLAVEGTCTRALPLRDVGSSAYRPLFPDVLAGPAIGVMTASVVASLAHRRAARLSGASLLCAWSVAPAFVDLVWWTEGGNRATGPVWGCTGVSLAVDALYPLIVWADRYVTGRIAPIAVVAGIAVLVTGVAARTVPAGARGATAAVGLSLLFLLERIPDWIAFLLD